MFSSNTGKNQVHSWKGGLQNCEATEEGENFFIANFI